MIARAIDDRVIYLNGQTGSVDPSVWYLGVGLGVVVAGVLGDVTAIVRAATLSGVAAIVAVDGVLFGMLVDGEAIDGSTEGIVK